MTPGALSPTARHLEAIIRASRTGKGGVHRVGRNYLAARLDRSVRQVSHYVRELKQAGRLHVTPPRKERVRGRWQSLGVNAYRLPHPRDLYPHLRRSDRGAGSRTLPLRGRDTGPRGGPGAAPTRPQFTPEEAAAYIAAVTARCLADGDGIPRVNARGR